MQTKKSDFALFKKECYKWIEILGLKDWKLVFTHMEDNCGVATYFRESAGRIITINLNTDFDGLLYSENGIKLSAFHEIIEGLLLARLDDMIDRRRHDEKEVEEARHKAVRILEHTLYPKYKNHNQKVEQ